MDDAPAASQPAAHLTDEAQAVEHQAETTIEAGSDSASVDTGYETKGTTFASTSLSSGVRDYAFEHGRRYHKYQEGRYLFPNDHPEQEREDMKHAMIVNLCGGRLHYAPIQNPHRILDVGTGTGIWAIDMGDEYPSAEVLGVDLSPIQPSWVPPNVKFMVDDAESTWLYPEEHFDLVHARHLASSIKNYPKLISNAKKHIKPGGWIELQELHLKPLCDDGTMKEDDVVKKWFAVVGSGVEKFGVDLLGPRKHLTYLGEAGFEQVQERVFKVPIGLWPKNQTLKTVGLYMRASIYDGLQGISMRPLTKGLGWSPEEVEVFLVDVRKALMDRSVHSYLTFHVCFGQKPMAKHPTQEGGA